ncbi:MAG: aminopeptidase [Acidobacteriota bacterium]
MDSSTLQQLAHQFMVNAVRVQPGDNIWLEYRGSKARVLADACAAKVNEIGGHPFLIDTGSGSINSTVGPLSAAGVAALGEQRLAKMKTMQGYIRVDDDADQAKITLPPEQMALYKKALQPVNDYRVNHTRWLVTAAPTEEFAAACGMSFADFEVFYRDVCLVDYSKMTEAVKPLEKLMAEGKKVRIYSPAQETDLSFSIEGIPAIPCTGTLNIPDGECFTAPVRDSISGTIRFGPSSYDGQKFSFIRLTFKNGHIDQAEAENAERTKVLNQMLDTDPGARYTGEFSINFNPFIRHPTGSILFDEKIDGGIHMAMGNCYDEAPNGNKSSVHWDMVHIQRLDYGGGELYIDDRLIRKDGIFVVPELQALNPENLKAVRG